VKNWVNEDRDGSDDIVVTYKGKKVATAGVVTYVNDDTVFMIKGVSWRNGYSVTPGKWGFAKGAIERSDQCVGGSHEEQALNTIRTAAWREACEELGLNERARSEWYDIIFESLPHLVDVGRKVVAVFYIRIMDDFDFFSYRSGGAYQHSEVVDWGFFRINRVRELNAPMKEVLKLWWK